MNSLIETLNRWGGHSPDFAWPMLWQSSVLIAVLFVFDLAARRKVRASVRYALWLVVLVKLLLPPTLALPTSLAWWVRPPASQPKAQPRTPAFVVTYGEFVPANFSTPAPPVFVPPPKSSLSGAGQAAATWVVVGAGLLVWLVVRWRQVAGSVRQAAVARALRNEVLDEAQHGIKLPRRVRLLVTNRAMSPAVCGLFRPVILLPQSLVERLTPPQLRAVLLHELVHLRRGDVWVNCVQALLQIFYWWHPLLWLANARIRRVREEAVDDAVMLALRDEAETYAPTLLEVAKLAFNRPLASLGLVGIMESRSALRQRIERLVDFHPPRKAGLTIASSLCVLAFAVLAVPMEQAPVTNAGPPPVEPSNENEEVRLRVIVLNKPVAGDVAQIRKLAEAIIAKVKGGASFSEMAAVYSEGRQGREGGDWGWVRKFDRDGALVLRKELADVAFFLKPGELSGIIETPEVIYLMLVEDKRPVDIKSPSAQDRKPLTGVNQAMGLTNSRPEAITNKVPVLGDIPLVGKLFRTDRATATNGAFSNALPKSVYEGTPGPRYVFSGKYHQVELREDCSYWAAGKRMNLEELRDWLVRTKQSGSNISIGFQIHSNAPPEVVRALTELRNDLGLVEGAASALPASLAPEQVQTRTFKLDPDTFYKGLESVSPLQFTRTNVSVAVTTFFSILGVDLASPSAIALGKSVWWSDRNGMLLIRATKQDLDLIEAAVEVLNHTPPQINIKVRFVELPQGESLDWYFGSLYTNLPLPRLSVSQFQGVLTDPQFRVVLRALEPRNGVDILTGPEVTTVSGRQAQIQVVDIQTVVTGINPQAQLSPGIVSTNGLTNSLYQTQAMPFGPVLDVVPYLASDGYTINMTVIPTVTEFLGYDDPAIYGLTNSSGHLDKTVLPLPRFRVRQMTATASVRDGQTLVLIGAVTTEVLRKPDGSTETKDVSSTQKKQLIVFITPTLVDPAGNRLHTDDEPTSRKK